MQSGQALEWPLRRYYSDEGWQARSERWKSLSATQMDSALQARAELFRDLLAAIDDEELIGEKGRELAARWRSLRKSEAGGDAEFLAGSTRAWADRRNWPVALRLKEANTYMMRLEEFERAADFLDRAVDEVPVQA